MYAIRSYYAFKVTHYLPLGYGPDGTRVASHFRIAASGHRSPQVRAALAGDQNGCFQIGQVFHKIEYIQHFFALADKIVIAVTRLQLSFRNNFV